MPLLDPMPFFPVAFHRRRIVEIGEYILESLTDQVLPDRFDFFFVFRIDGITLRLIQCPQIFDVIKTAFRHQGRDPARTMETILRAGRGVVVQHFGKAGVISSSLLM